MATRCLTRSLFLIPRQTLASTVSRSYTAVSSAAPPSSSYLLRLRPLFAAASGSYFRRLTPAFATRGLSTRSTSSSLNDPNPNWTNRPPKETILLDGCDFEHWLVVMEKPEGDPTRDEIIDSYIDTLAMVVGSVEEARMKIYSVSTRHYYAFGALVSEEVSYKMKDLPRVRWVLPDSYLDVRNKDYGGEPFINGQAMPYDPKYHEEWVRNNARANDRNRRNDRPRNFDRSRNFDRRRDFQNSGGPPGRPMGGPANTGAPPNMGGPVNTGAPPNMGGMQQQPNMGGPQPNYTGGAPPNMGGMQQQQPNMGGMQPNYTGGAPQQQPNMGPPPNNTGGYPPTNMAPPHNNAANYPGAPYQSGPGPSQGGAYGPNMGPAPRHNQGGGYGPNIGPAPGHNQGGGYGPNMGPAPVHNQGGYAPNMGPAPGQNQNYSPNFSGGNPNQNQNIPGRDMPPRSNQS